MAEAETDSRDLSDEARRVVVWRFTEARAAGLTRPEARLFAESDRDVSELRRLVQLECPPALIARIVI